MSDADDSDLFGGEGLPTSDQVKQISAYLRRHNRDNGPRAVHREASARGFTVSVATVQRYLVGTPTKTRHENKPHAVQEATARRADAKSNGKKMTPPPALKIEDVDRIDEDLIAKMKDLLVETNTSTSLAIQENRTRMALNIVVAQTMAARPELLLLDMRGSAALIDALTVAAKLSGGASIDITLPTEEDRRSAAAGIGSNGHAMVDITPVRTEKTALAADLEAFRRQRRINGNGQGA